MKRALGLALVSLVAVGFAPSPSRAMTTHPLVNDPVGDVDGLPLACVAESCVSTLPGHDPSLDIVTGDLSATSSVLRAAVQVDDVDAPLSDDAVMEAGYVAVVELLDGTLAIEGLRDPSTGVARVRVLYDPPGPELFLLEVPDADVAVVADDTVVMTVTFDAVNRVITGAGGRAIGLGTAVDVQFATRRWRGSSVVQAGPAADHAGSGGVTYRLGD